LPGHRDNFFRPLRNIRKGQVITLQTSTASFRYRVQTTAIVSPTDVAVLAPSRGQTLTLATCFPF
jgi:sortase A